MYLVLLMKLKKKKASDKLYMDNLMIVALEDPEGLCLLIFESLLLIGVMFV